MKIYNRFTSELDGSGEKISQGLSEVDLSNPEDVKALIPDHAADILVHFGDADFLDRYRRFEEHLPEWRTVYPKLSSVDMRYERQVVLEMQPGSGVPMTSSINTGAASPSAEAPAATSMSSAAAVPAAGKPSARAASRVRPAAAKHAASAKAKTAAKTPAHGTSMKSAAKKAAKAKPHAAAAKHHTVVVRPTPGAPLYHPPQVVHP
jgi:cell division protein FtsQ